MSRVKPVFWLSRQRHEMSKKELEGVKSKAESANAPTRIRLTSRDGRCRRLRRAEA